jgi:hypothetical protein
MKQMFAPNISNRGRLMRGITALILFVGAAFGLRVSVWLTVGLGIAGAFVLFEALRGWCALRACGIKTKY